MADRRVEQLAARVLEAISDPRVCGHGGDALRKMIVREIRGAVPQRNARIDGAINQGAQQIAGRVEDLCRGLPAGVRATGVVVAAAGAIYGVSQMPEEEIRAAIARIRTDVIDRRIMIAGQAVNLSLSTDLAPLFGQRATVNTEARWRQQLFGVTGNARLYGNDVAGSGVYGGSFSAPLDGGRMEFGANTRDGGTVYFRMELSF